MATSGGLIGSQINKVHRFFVNSGVFPGALSQCRHYAARKGTREKARKKKVKTEVKKISFAEKVRLSKKLVIKKPDALIYDLSEAEAQDDVYFQRYFKWKIYPFAEAIQCHREFLHPTMYNAPESIVNAYIELNMQGIKKTKPVESFHRIVSIQHPFDHGEERNILVFCKSETDVKDALEAGANLAGGSDVIKLILSGEVSLHNYDTVLANPAIMPEVLTLRGLLRKKHPNIKTGTLGIDVKQLVYTHLHGIKYDVKPYEHFPEFGSTTVSIGKLNMDIEHLENNLKLVIESIMSVKPKRPGSFITRIRLLCPPSDERFKIDHNLYIEEEAEPKTLKKPDEDEDESDDEAVAVPI